MLNRLRARDDPFQAMRGRAEIESRGEDVRLALALASPGFMRAEVIGALGLRLALVTANESYVQMYVPREKQVFRLDAKEFWKASERREQFLRLLPLSLPPEILPSALMNRVSPDYWSLKDKNPPEGFDCQYIEPLNVYEMRFANQVGTGGRIVAVDPDTLSPIQLEYFETNLPPLKSFNREASVQALFFDEVGTGHATLKSRIEVYWFHNGTKERIKFRWLESEVWPSVNPEAFNFRPNASARVKEY